MSAVALLLALLLAATGIDRTVDPALTAIAERRVVEVQTDFSHAGYDPCCAEIIAWNAGHIDPVAHVVGQWRGSPPHWSILADPSHRSIGCAVAQVDVRTFAVCVLAAKPSAPVPISAPGPAGQPSNVGGFGAQGTPLPAATPVVAVIPDAAMAVP